LFYGHHKSIQAVSAWHKIFRWMNEKWLLTNERTNERSRILFVETLLRNRIVRPGVVFFHWMNEK
jgi:hypothetical protein